MVIGTVARSSARAAYRNFLATKDGVESYRIFQRLVYGAEDSLVQELFRRTIRHLPKGRDVHLCDVGAGDGRRTSAICEMIQEHSNCIVHIDAIEQSPVYVERLRSRTFLTKGRVRIFGERFEKTHVGGVYDLAFFIHSIFGMEGSDLLDRMLAMRADHGVLIVASNATSGLFAALKNLLDTEYANGRLEIDLLTDGLRDQHVAYELHEFETAWEIERDCLDQAVDWIGQWLSMGRYDRLDETVREQYRKALFSYADAHNGRVAWRERENILIVPR